MRNKSINKLLGSLMIIALIISLLSGCVEMIDGDESNISESRQTTVLSTTTPVKTADTTTSVTTNANTIATTTPAITNANTTTATKPVTTPKVTTAKPAPSTTLPIENQTEKVWVSGSGKKYHSSSSCSNMKSPKQITLTEAKAQGKTACSKCY